MRAMLEIFPFLKKKRMMYSAVGVQRVGMGRYCTRFVVLKPSPHLLSNDWLSRLGVGKETKSATRRVILCATRSFMRGLVAMVSSISAYKFDLLNPRYITSDLYA